MLQNGQQIPDVVAQTLTLNVDADATWTQTVTKSQQDRLRELIICHDVDSRRAAVAIWIGLLAFDLNGLPEDMSEVSPSEDTRDKHRALRDAARLGGEETTRWEQNIPKSIQQALQERLPEFQNDSERGRAFMALGLSALETAIDNGDTISEMAFRAMQSGEKSGEG